MLGEIKTWIEGLFRPVIVNTQAGRSYIDRTPTVWDIDRRGQQQYLRKNYATTPAGGATIGTEYYTVSPRTVIITGLSMIKTSANGTAAWYGISNNDPLNAQTDMTSNAIAISIYSPVNLLNNMIPLVVPAGKSLNVAILGGGGILSTAIIYISYIEVD